MLLATEVLSLWILIGAAAGLLIWVIFVRPRQINTYERKRRELGLPPKRRLPEDDEKE